MRRQGDDMILEELSEEEILQNAKVGMASSDQEGDGEEAEADDGIPFTTKLRAATRQVHRVSDALVNAKLGIAMSDDKVWAEGLLVFYEIFRFLEEASDRLSLRNSHFTKVNEVVQDIRRTEAFEEDLKYYYGANFLKEYQIRPQVASYLKHLKTLEEREPLRLLAYMYHLYMGLLSGGQILKRKRELRKTLQRSFNGILRWLGHHGARRVSTITTKPGNAVTTFSLDGRTIGDIKRQIIFTINDLSIDLSKDEKESLISESVVVFQKNNDVVSSIEKTGWTALKNLAGNGVVLFLVVALATYYCVFVFSK